ncbi:hypothetical protein I317_02133 [Kwoniella heveanensis CBS 569]|nr:hypothetical protein I317_02133 [Kwoniella heveanensis CBS 569]
MSISSNSSSSSFSQGQPIPRVGSVRCYWALVTPRYVPVPGPSTSASTSSDGPSSSSSASATADNGGPGPGPNTRLSLEFVHPDPILGNHLGKEKLSMMGRGVIEFIHPHEREQARRDLSSAIASDDLQGSVTRVRFARLSRIRTILGCQPEENDFPVDAEKFAEDDEYLILDLVLNWVANGLLLAFFHAIKDKDPVANNDPRRNLEGWSNWCGTREMSDDDIEALHHNITTVIPPSPLTRYPPMRVFQLHYAAPSLDPSQPPQPSRLIFSWPPPRPVGVRPQMDGLYNAQEFAELMKGVDMDPSQLTSGPDELRTNCTTRYGAQHSITTEGVYRHVTSVFIPYGSLTFACFQTSRMYDLPSAQSVTSNTVPQNNSDGYGSVASPGLRSDWTATSSPVPASAVPPSSATSGTHQPTPSPHSSHTYPPNPGWTAAHTDTGRGVDGEWESTASPSYSVYGNGRDAGYPPSFASSSTVPYHEHSHHSSHLHAHSHSHPHPHQPSHSHHSHTHQHSRHHVHSHVHGHPPHSHSHGHHDDPFHPQPLPMSVGMSSQLSDSMSNGHGHGQGQSTNGNGHTGHLSHDPQMSSHLIGGMSMHPNGVSGGSGGGGGGGGVSSRPLVRPPGNVECCVMCGIRESPEWRRNESGIKDLCNA